MSWMVAERAGLHLPKRQVKPDPAETRCCTGVVRLLVCRWCCYGTRTSVTVSSVELLDLTRMCVGR